MRKPLRKLVQSHFEQASLSKEQQQRLQSLSARYPAPPAMNRRRLTIALLATATLIGVYLHQLRMPAFNTNMPQRIAEEVAKNHIKMKPLEIETASMNEVRRYFTQLEFSPTDSRTFDLSPSKLLGGRYCSIQGITAAQLRYRDDNGNWVTLYQTQYLPAVFSHIPDVDRGETPITLYTKGLKITLWVEKGLLMASASVD